MARGLGELLVREQLISLDQLEKAKREQKNTGGGRLGTALVKLGYLKEKDLTHFLSKQYGVPAIDLVNFEIMPEVIKLIPRDICEKHLVVPVSRSGSSLVLAMSDPSNLVVQDDIRFLTRLKIEPVIASEISIQSAIERYYGSSTNYEGIMTELEQDTSVGEVTRIGVAQVTNLDGDKQVNDAPVIKFVNQMLGDAIKMRASDIHIEPYEKRFRVRFRIDGSLYEKIQPPPEISAAITSRLKIMSNLDISERRRPQDGRIKIRRKDGSEVDFRVSVLPTLYGEKIVMRLLDKANLQLDLTIMGLEERELSKLKAGIYAPYGMVLVTGPTGSGKSTTIYSCLSDLNKVDVNISTCEDPVEYNIEGINQVQVNPEVDLTFANALRSFLRQDPDIIMVGEIRDYETAEIAFKAALTGHLVMSTLHTNDAPSSIHRLLNMGVEPFLVTAGVNLIIAQRLVRKICQSCKAAINVDPKVLKDLGVAEAEIPGLVVYQGHGCGNCNDIGYKGRIAIYEVMPFTEGMKNLVYQNATATELKRAAINEGMQSLRVSAINKMKLGVTTIQEVVDNSMKDLP